MSGETITLRKFKNDIQSTTFYPVYQDFISKKKGLEISKDEAKRILSIALLCLNYGDSNVEILGYRLLLRYSIFSGDFKPLYDFATAKELIPITKHLEHKYFIIPEDINFATFFISSYDEIFKYKDFFFTKHQRKMFEYSRNSEVDSVIIAPTSYGKSELILERLEKQDFNRACIIVPTKSLLSQTQRRIFSHSEKWRYKIITHPDMYRIKDVKLICIFTQERLLRLLKKDKFFSLDLLLVDEAHNLLEDNERSILLGYVLLILRKRNLSLRLVFYSPFISDPENINIKKNPIELSAFNVNEIVKIEHYYLCRKRENSYLIQLYDQFLDEKINIEDCLATSDFELVRKYAGSKNIIYINKPRDIEDLSQNMISRIPFPETIPDEVQEIIASISELLHNEYLINDCIRRGFVYHHGTIPDIIRLFIENIFSNYDYFQYIITSSTLLEGVNLPAEKLFVLNNMKGSKKLNQSQFKNLVGRVCRFNEIFHNEKGRIERLEPEIYIVAGDYQGSNLNLENFYSDTVKVDQQIKDVVNNIFLKDETSLSDNEREVYHSRIEFLENIEPETVEHSGIRYAETVVGRFSYQNHIYEFNIYDNELQLSHNIENLRTSTQICNPNQLLEAIYSVFINNISYTEAQKHKNKSFLRLQNLAARHFYAMFISWRTEGSSYKRMIANYLNYWDKIEDPIIYIGPRWGEIKRNETDRIEAFINIRSKDEPARVNLAIKKIKEEQDFVDNQLLKFMETLNDLGLIEQPFYERVKYGTNDPQLICLLKNGISIELARLLLSERYSSLIEIDSDNDEFLLSKDIEAKMKFNGENKLLLFEVKFHINLH